MLRVVEKFEKTDVGRQRRSNEDSLFSREPVFAVADGMGGAQAGEVASQLAVEAFQAGLPDGGTPEEKLARVALDANERIHAMSRQDQRRAGMGTTLTAAHVGEDEVTIAHVGDSRAYRLRDGELVQLTRDHSLVGELVRQGKLTPAQAEEHPQRSIITRALGPEATVEVDTRTYAGRPGDVYLLCSDGLTSMVTSEDELRRILQTSSTLQEAGQALIDAANERGGRDNITVVLFRLGEAGELASVDSTLESRRPDDDDGPPTTVIDPVAAQATRESTRRTPPGEAGSDPTITGFRAIPEGLRERAAAEAAPPRRTAPLPGEGRARRRRRRRGRGALRAGVVALVVLALLAVPFWIASRAVYFLGVSETGQVTVFRGFPYEAPFGVELYEAIYTTGVRVAQVPSSRREVLRDHRLRSNDDVRELVKDLELGRLAS